MSEETKDENAEAEEVTEEVEASTEAEAPAEEVAAEPAAEEEVAVEAETEPAEKAAPEPAKEEVAAEAEAEPAADAAPEEEVKTSEEAFEEAAPAEEEKSEKLKRAEEILRSNAPASNRGEDLENAFEKVVHINRCSKVVKGGRRFSFSALVVSGDREGRVGFGFGKAQEVSECIKKSSEASRKDMIKVNITENTIPHPVIGEHGGGRVLLRPASPGTGLIAGGGVRAVVEAAGIKDVLAKSMGSNNQANVVKATINALEQLRTKEEIYSLRGKKLAEKKAL
ncbi:MAG: 30S ribosomal protein S5 [Verrucomicrobiota bacterium]